MTKASTDLDARIGKRLRMRRQDLRLTVVTLSGLMGVTYQQLCKYETGANRIAASRLQGLADLLSVPVEYFYDPPENPKKSMVVADPQTLEILTHLKAMHPKVRAQLLLFTTAVASARTTA